jgi:lipid II:glycine glycyltransferase (peptidoglycan interpeptide bridge formation enzyme)
MSAYLMQWEAIRAAKKEGYKIYDLGAIAPSEEKHKWKGLRDFKVKFGGKQVNLMGCFDLVYSPFWYNLFQIGEKIRRHE